MRCHRMGSRVYGVFCVNGGYRGAYKQGYREDDSPEVPWPRTSSSSMLVCTSPSVYLRSWTALWRTHFCN